MSNEPHIIFRNVRKAAGITQEEAGRLLHRDKRTISLWETGAGPLPEWATQSLIAEIQGRKYYEAVKNGGR